MITVEQVVDKLLEIDDLTMGDLVVSDDGDLGFSLDGRFNGKHMFVNQLGSEELRNWLDRKLTEQDGYISVDKLLEISADQEDPPTGATPPAPLTPEEMSELKKVIEQLDKFRELFREVVALDRWVGWVNKLTDLRERGLLRNVDSRIGGAVSRASGAINDIIVTTGILYDFLREAK